MSCHHAPDYLSLYFLLCTLDFCKIVIAIWIAGIQARTPGHPPRCKTFVTFNVNILLGVLAYQYADYKSVFFIKKAYCNAVVFKCW